MNLIFKAHCIRNKNGTRFHSNSKRGYVDGLVILANSMYSKPEESAQETIHNLADVFSFSKKVCTVVEKTVNTPST